MIEDIVQLERDCISQIADTRAHSFHHLDQLDAKEQQDENDLKSELDKWNCLSDSLGLGMILEAIHGNTCR